MEDNNFEDTGIYYANQDMIRDQVALSMNSHLTYNIKDDKNVKIIKKVSDSFYQIAQNDIKDEAACYFGQASIYREFPTFHLIWEY